MSYGFASNLRDALPNASFIGFTGTPIEKRDARERAEAIKLPSTTCARRPSCARVRSISAPMTLKLYCSTFRFIWFLTGFAGQDR
jgi:hypothetical protein